jgi:hypothetical protein
MRSSIVRANALTHTQLLFTCTHTRTNIAGVLPAKGGGGRLLSTWRWWRRQTEAREADHFDGCDAGFAGDWTAPTGAIPADARANGSGPREGITDTKGGNRTKNP